MSAKRRAGRKRKFVVELDSLALSKLPRLEVLDQEKESSSGLNASDTGTDGHNLYFIQYCQV